MRYTNESIQFYKADVTYMDKITKKYNVVTEPTAYQLPTVLMIENGKETAKYPPALKSGIKAAGPADYSERKIVKYLELDSKFYATSAK